MAGPVRAHRLSGAICIGMAFGISLWAILPKPRIPAVKAFIASPIAYLASSSGPIQPTGHETPEQTGTRLLFVGDIMLDRNVARRSKEAGDVAYPFKKLPSGWFDSFDYAIGNLEGPVTDRRRAPEKSIDFLFDPSVIPMLKAQGIDAFSQANNHALDQGSVGYSDSVRRLREAGFLTFGHQVDDGSVSLATTTVNGTRVAFLGYNTTDNPLNRTQASPVIALAGEESDVVIAYVHWGNEYRDKPDASSIETAHWLIDQGVDVVIGGHPHWTQGFSSYKGKPIAWSLGNFIFDQDFSIETRQGIALALTTKGKEIIFEIIPIQIDSSQPHVVEGEERVKRLEALAKVSDEELREQVRGGRIGF